MKDMEKLSKQESKKVAGGIIIDGDKVYLSTLGDFYDYRNYMTSQEYFLGRQQVISQPVLANRAITKLVLAEHKAEMINDKLDAKDPDYNPEKRKRKK